MSAKAAQKTPHEPGQRWLSDAPHSRMVFLARRSRAESRPSCLSILGASFADEESVCWECGDAPWKPLWSSSQLVFEVLGLALRRLELEMCLRTLEMGFVYKARSFLTLDPLRCCRIHRSKCMVCSIFCRRVSSSFRLEGRQGDCVRQRRFPVPCDASRALEELPLSNGCHPETPGALLRASGPGA